MLSHPNYFSGTPTTERRRPKIAVYAEAGIACYWRVELEPEPSISVSTLQGGLLVEVETARAGTTGTLTIPFPIELDPHDLVR